jgi:hypothetical protein
MVPAVQNISVLYHVQNVARTPHLAQRFAVEDTATALLALVVLSVLWLGLALWRVRRFEFGSADG